MKVAIFSGSHEASLFARSLPLARKLRELGVECIVIPPIVWHSVAKGKLGHILLVAVTYNPKTHIQTIINTPDVVIIGRTSTPQIYIFQKILKKRGAKLIFDLNDALFLPIGNLFGINIRPGSFFLEKILVDADYVTTNGHYLLNYVKVFNKRSCIVHDPVDVDLFHPNKKRNSDKIMITWEGNAKVNYYNLTLLVNPLKRIAKEYGKRVKFKIVSYLGDQRIKALFGPLEKFIEVDYGSEQWLPMKEHAKLIYDTDIMVAPLQSTRWNEGKSALRVGIGMALGIPVIASPVGEQKYVIRHGVNGFLANNEEEWYTYLKILIEDEHLRKKMGKEGRKIAENELSLEVNGKKLYEIIKRTLEMK